MGGIAGFLLGNHGVEDAGQFVGSGDDAFGFAQPRFDSFQPPCGQHGVLSVSQRSAHAAGIAAQRGLAFGSGPGGPTKGGGDPVGDAPGFSLEEAAACAVVERKRPAS